MMYTLCSDGYLYHHMEPWQLTKPEFDFVFKTRCVMVGFGDRATFPITPNVYIAGVCQCFINWVSDYGTAAVPI
jgi:hypothetical protein